MLSKDFRFRDDIKADTVPIEILEGPFAGVVLRFTSVQIREQEDGTARMLFDYELHEMKHHSETSLRKNVKFTETAGLILNQLILEKVDTDNNPGSLNEHREDDSEGIVEE